MIRPQHYPWALPLEAIAAFLRGYERGPAYGPQLQEFYHKCDGPQRWLTPGVSRDRTARVVNGKLLVRTSYSLQVSLQRPFAALQLDQLSYIGCGHSPGSLPALVMEAIDHIDSPSKAPRCYDYINCAECATDLRVAVLPTKSDQLVAQITTWQCYGGRDIHQEDRTVRTLFGYGFAYPGEGESLTLSYRSALPSRNLELQYNESLGDGGSLTNGLQQRHRWLHWWDWSYPGEGNYPFICGYIGPD